MPSAAVMLEFVTFRGSFNHEGHEVHEGKGIKAECLRGKEAELGLGLSSRRLINLFSLLDD